MQRHSLSLSLSRSQRAIAPTETGRQTDRRAARERGNGTQTWEILSSGIEWIMLMLADCRMDMRESSSSLRMSCPHWTHRSFMTSR